MHHKNNPFMREKMLNEKYDFAKDAPADAQAAFIGAPVREVLVSSMKLYRFLDKTDGITGRWWFDNAGYDDLVRRIQLSSAGSGSSTLIGAGREGLAVSHAFKHDMTYICMVELKKPVVGWKGPTSAQPQAMFYYYEGGSLKNWTSPDVFRGNTTQIYIPNFQKPEVFYANANLLYKGEIVSR